MVKRRVHGNSTGGSYAFGPKASPQRLQRLRMESGKIRKQDPAAVAARQGELVDELMRALATRNHPRALEVVEEMIVLEPEGAFWHQKHGDVLRVLDRELEAAAAYRSAAQCYLLRGLTANARVLQRVADMLESTIPGTPSEE
jgi:hypothetical protein